MTQELKKPETSYLANMDYSEEYIYHDDPLWIKDLRKKARTAFKKIGFPTARRGNEEWKYTDVGPIAKSSFCIPKPHSILFSGEDQIENLCIGSADWTKLVFINGKYSEDISNVCKLPAGVVVSNLKEAFYDYKDLLEKYLTHCSDHSDNAFAALNTACIHEGAFVYIPDDTIVDQPIEILFISGSTEEEVISQPRVLLLIGKNSKASVLENHNGITGLKYFNNAVTEIVVGDRAKLEFYKLQTQFDESFHITNTEVVLGRDSSFSSVNIDLGGKLVRNNLNLLTQDEGSSSILNGLYLVTGNQHVDNQVIIDHAKPYTTSRELYKGILDGKSRSVFHGSIIVREGAIKVDANQVDKNLLLSDKAEANTKPAFWVYCDDVKCGHGAACGQMDENALFYLRSRGIDEKSARSILTLAFVAEVIDSIANEHLRSEINRLVHYKLQDWLGVES